MLQQTTVTVPDDIRAKFHDLVDLILQSESMNDEERQYWINILPVITQEQIQSLRDILENEKRQLAAIDKKYAQEIEKIGQEETIKQSDGVRRSKRTARAVQEESFEREDEVQTENILKKIEGEATS